MTPLSLQEIDDFQRTEREVKAAEEAARRAEEAASRTQVIAQDHAAAVKHT